jgi:hypothetical protein
LLDAGADLERALGDAQRKDGGFSAAVLAWVLESSNLAAMGRSAGASPEEVADLLAWRNHFIARLVACSAP